MYSLYCNYSLYVNTLFTILLFDMFLFFFFKPYKFYKTE